MTDPRAIDALGMTLEWALIHSSGRHMAKWCTVDSFIILVSFELTLDGSEGFKLLLLFCIGVTNL